MPSSVPQSVFGHRIYDRTICPDCNRVSEWDLYSNMVFSMYANDIHTLKAKTMERLLKSLSQKVDFSTECIVDKCDGNVTLDRRIKRYPMVFAISVLWSTTSATKAQVSSVLNYLPHDLDLSAAFEPFYAENNDSQNRRNSLKSTRYTFRGFVCYYGQHYFAFFYSTAHKSWLLLDDKLVVQVGKWSNVVDK